jgi:putative tryptophan/tyrosine transport system substrate-binding protein
MRRREFITLLGGAAAAWPVVAAGQQLRRPMIGVLSPVSSAAATRYIEAFRAGLRDFGYEEGRNIAFEFRFSDGMPGRMPDLAAELVALKPAVIVTGSTPGALSARGATRTIPILVTQNQDPMALGLAVSMARPGGNVTGFWSEGDESLIGKRLELLKEAVPGTAKVGFLVNPDDVTDSGALTSLPGAARALGLAVRILDVRAATEFEAAFATAGLEGVQAIHVSQGPLFNTYRGELAAMALRARLPAVYGFREFAVAGGLISYATSLPDIYRRFAALVDKILKGTSPADLPIERATKFELVINLKTAKALSLEVPASLLARADEVIE